MNMVNTVWSEEEVSGTIQSDINIDEIIEKNRWHYLFESPRWILLNPADEVIDFYRKYMQSPLRAVQNRLSGNYHKIHDLGVGGGRHLFFFKELGYEVVGSDLSTNAIDFVKQEMKTRQIDARLEVCPMTDLPFEDGEFDITISRATINHANLQDMKKIIFEVARTTRKGGLFFVTVSSDRASDFRGGTEVVKDLTYIPNEGPEAGLIHTFFTATNAAALLEPYFSIQEVYLAEHPSHMPTAPGATDPSKYFGSEYVIIGIRR